MKVDVDVQCETSHYLAVEWKWEVPEGLIISAPADSPPLRLTITVTQMDHCGSA